MPLVVDPPKAQIADDLKVKCAGVVDVPERDLSLTETSRLWAQDRVALGACAPRHNALVDSVEVSERRR